MLLKSADFESMYMDPETLEEYPAWKNDFEARFPDDTWEDTTQLKTFMDWIVSTDRTQATGDTLPESVTYGGVTYTSDTADYRLAKFNAEVGDYIELDSFVFYYIFTELFLMVDSRAKNLFIGFHGSECSIEGIRRKLVAEPYDMDTALGTNNEGTLAFSYSLEDTDQVNGANVFNGQDSVLWNNLRDTKRAEIVQMYQSLRSSGALSYTAVENRFDAAQSKWPEALWMEDAQVKYIEPLVDPQDGKEATDFYLPMHQGTKEQQRKWWLQNRFRYMDSKWNAGDALSQVIQLRGYAKADISVTPYIDLYPTVKYGSYLIQKRGTAGVASLLECPMDNVDDTEIYIYSAPSIASVGDLSGLKVGVADFSQAVNIQTVKLGDANTNYVNNNMKSLSFGNNVLLKRIDVRNCAGLGTAEQKSVDVSNCAILEEVYFEGTSIQGLTLPRGGVLRVLHLPAVANLTVIGQKHITDFSIESYANISTLRIENSSLDARAILGRIPANTRVRLVGVAWEATDAEEIDNLYDLLDTMRGLDENGNNTDTAQVSGTIHVAALRGSEVAEFQSRYPYIQLNVDAVESTLIYKSYNGSETLKTVTCHNGVPQSTPPSIPSRASTAQYRYTAAGWATLEDQQSAEYPAAGPTTGMQADTTLYAAYSRTVRTYTVTWKNSDGTVLETDTNVSYGSTPHYDGSTPQNPTSGGGSFQNWTPAISAVTGDVTYTASYIVTYTVYFYNGSTLLQTVTGVAQGSSATYTGSTPVYSGEGDPDDYSFNGWSPSPTNIQANTSCYAQFKYIGVPETISDSWDDIITSVNNGTYASKYSVGDTKRLDLGSAGVVAMQIAAIDADALANESGNAAITWISQQLLSDNHRMNPALETVYKYESGPSWVRGNTSSYNWTSKNSYVANNVAKMSLKITAVADGTIKLGYNAGNSSSSNVRLTLKVNNETVVSAPVNSLTRYELPITAGNEYNIEITHTSVSAANSSTGTFRIDDSSNSNTVSNLSSLITVSDIVIDNCSVRSIDYYTTGTGAIGGWTNSEMRTYLKETIKPLIPANVRAAIKNVTKYSYGCNTAGTIVNNEASTEDVWIPSYREVFASGETQGPTYNSLFTDANSRKKMKAGASSASGWWLRSAYNSSTFGGVNGSGGNDPGNASTSNGVVLGFCM